MPLAMEQAGELFYLAYDQVGSLRAVSDTNGVVQKSVLYDSFGRVISDNNPELKVPFGFAGGLQDSETGLVRFGYRDYDPEVGRWTSKDPIGFEGGESSLYYYAGSNPIALVDPSGLISSCPCTQSWTQCFTNCIKYFDILGIVDVFTMSNLAGNVLSGIAGRSTTIRYRDVVVTLYYGDGLLAASSPAIAAAAGLLADGVIAASASYLSFLSGASYGCMLSCAMDQCSY
ncbi:RHS repeat domain-containing protein [Megalodesulfovibrio paquesii]